MGHVYIKLNHDIVDQELKNRILVANRLLLEDIYDRSLYRTPMGDTSELRRNVSRLVEDNKAIIEWKQPYSSYQERGSRYDGSHVVKNYTTPGTGKDFAKNAVQEALADVERFYRGLI